jgi:hypothetical protein
MDVYNKIDTGTRFYDVNGDFISEHTAVLYKVGDKIADVGSVAVVVPITPSGGGGGGAGGTVSFATRQITVTTVTTNGTIAGNYFYLLIELSPDFVGTIMGVSRLGSDISQLDPWKGDSAAITTAVPYTITSGSLTITRIF